MAQALQQLSIPGPGVQGLNSEISPFQQGLDFALRADNAVIDRIGRIAAREAFADYISSHEITLAEGETFEIVRLEYVVVDEQDLDAKNVAEYSVSFYSSADYSEVRSAGVPGTTIFGIAGIGRVGQMDYDRYIGITIDEGTIKEVSNVTPTYGVNRAQLVPFKNAIYSFSKGDPVMVYEGGVASKLSDDPDYVPPTDQQGVIYNEIDGDIACAAYGRLWVSGINGDYDTVYWSDLLRPTRWYDATTDGSNTAGLINVREYWPNGNDKIQGIAAHNGFLIIFGNHSILIYSGPQGDPAGDNGLRLQDAIRDVGLANQDAMCNVGSDLLFVDSLGVRSLGRVVQEKSTPISEPSLNVATLIRADIANNRDTVRLSHLSSKTIAICLFPKLREAYCFQLGQPGATGGLRTTRWTGCDFYTGVTLQTDNRETELLGGRDGRGVLAYSGYTQPEKYTLSYESSVLLSGDALMQTLVPKSISFSYHRDLVGSNPPNPPQNLFCRWGFSTNLMPYLGKIKTQETRIGKVSQFRTGKCNVKGSGDMMRVGFDFDIDGRPFAMQQISINTLSGRILV
jgi:hypothetical protein